MPSPACDCDLVKIQLRIVRDNANSLKDEIFTISQGTHNDWRINHKSPFSRRTLRSSCPTVAMFSEYLQNIFNLLKVDDERFQFLQLDVPCYPVVMVSRSDVLVGKDTFSNLMQVVENVLYNWPYNVKHWSP